MVQYQCKRCAYSTNLRANIVSHLSRKRICDPILCDTSQKDLLEEITKPRDDAIYTCQFCNKHYVTNRKKNLHEGKCMKKSQYVRDLEEKVKRLESKGSTKNQGVVVNNNNDGDVNMIIINIQSVDDPNLEKIKSSKILGISTRKDAVERLTKHVYFNKDIPENHSIYAPSTNTNDLKMHNGKTMRKVRYPDKAIKKVVKKLIDILNNNIKNNPDEFKNKIEDAYDLDDDEEIERMETELLQIISSSIDDPQLIPKYMKIFHDNKDMIKAD